MISFEFDTKLRHIIKLKVNLLGFFGSYRSFTPIAGQRPDTAKEDKE